MSLSKSTGPWRSIGSRDGDGLPSLAAARGSQRRRIGEGCTEIGWVVQLHGGAAAERSEARPSGNGVQAEGSGAAAQGLNEALWRETGGSFAPKISMIGETSYPPTCVGRGGEFRGIAKKI